MADPSAHGLEEGQNDAIPLVDFQRSARGSTDEIDERPSLSTHGASHQLDDDIFPVQRQLQRLSNDHHPVSSETGSNRSNDRSSQGEDVHQSPSTEHMTSLHQSVSDAGHSPSDSPRHSIGDLPSHHSSDAEAASRPASLNGATERPSNDLQDAEGQAALNGRKSFMIYEMYNFASSLKKNHAAFIWHSNLPTQYFADGCGS